ncbi:SDR family NAD(P)-dependent oxidoreductase [Legionella longbeachae]|uniref:Putative oxidoreductase n=1 Tax=Legionella longbeachae serogroup 1 (strain NSW150) TaxID=661367 RepID=D3HRF2_LEGLN|nr:SDR family NAD(P)-dependent oxidoreductase [Legionella longbeachae]VEE01985.1 oxidoreductase [Legionella oakridgensis]HBD7396764.1 SDR family NAD(P)-dependent oxidoreductase [Legionella pneumophila]ARB91706.1 KR domain-containing protein [Legionella longbeachae]QIN35222.1 SDR family NAD(P)-dependent oxidoreductase [Legionella longbeachae]RZV28152.1 SDR family NAD(P)-dependent oxidoreductase [Legionella longbeachae]
MRQRTWLILGASSIIAEKFAHIVAQSGYQLVLVGRQANQLDIIAKDIRLRYQVSCEVILVDLATQTDKLLAVLQNDTRELDVFIAHSDFTDNSNLNTETITQLVKTNILTTTLLIHSYFNRSQKEYHLIFLSSVAACRGRAKNSLYGASKASIEIYLQGIQQAASKNQHITIAHLGFIDTKQTYGLPGIFYAASPYSCAKACLKALNHKKRMIYYPFFWRTIMAIITRLPFFLYKKMSSM